MRSAGVPLATLLALVLGAAVLGVALAGDEPKAASLTGTIRDAKGDPMARAIVSVEGGGETRTAADGTWTISPVSPGDALVTAKVLSHGRVQSLLHVTAGESRRWDATIGPAGVLQGRVVDEYGHPLTRPAGEHAESEWRVVAVPEQEWMRRPDSETWWCPTDADGAFRLRVSPDAMFRLYVARVATPHWVLVSVMTEPMSAGFSDLTLRVLPANTPHAKVRLRLEDCDGKPISGDTAVKSHVELCWADGGHVSHFDFDAAKGAWISNRVATGVYSVVASIPGRGACEFPGVRVPDAADVDLGTLRTPKSGRVRVALAQAGVPSDVVVRLRLLGARSSDGPGPYLGRTTWGSSDRELKGDAAAEFDLFPGHYFAGVTPTASEVRQWQYGYVDVPFDVRAGETTNVTIPMRRQPAGATWIRIRWPRSRPSQAFVVMSEAGGAIVCNWPIPDTTNPEYGFHLPPGSYAVVAKTSDRRRLTATLDIPAENAPDKFDVVLR